MVNDSMYLSETERGWAREIKNAMLEENKEIAETISDYEYVQHAIVAKENWPKALKRIKRLHQFKQSHGIPGNYSVDDAFKAIKKFEALVPKLFLAFGTDWQGRSVSTWNYNEFLVKNFKGNADAWKVAFNAYYYLFEAMNSDFAAIREGCVVIVETRGLGWKNFSMEMNRRAAELYKEAYPLRIKEMSLLNSPRVLRFMFALVSPFLSKKVKDAFHMDGKLDDVLTRFPVEILPQTMEGKQSTKDMEKALKDALQQRYEHKKTFKL